MRADQDRHWINNVSQLEQENLGDPPEELEYGGLGEGGKG